MISRYAFILVSPGADTDRDSIVIDTGHVRSQIILLPDPSAVADGVARSLADGAQLIELCGAFGPHWTAKGLEAANGRVPIGSVAFGAESVVGLAALITD